MAAVGYVGDNSRVREEAPIKADVLGTHFPFEERGAKACAINVQVELQPLPVIGNEIVDFLAVRCLECAGDLRIDVRNASPLRLGGEVSDETLVVKVVGVPL